MRERDPRKLLDTLTEAEKEAAMADGLLFLLLLDRWGNEHRRNMLKFWKSNHSYVILGKWLSFIRLFQMEVGDAIHLCTFFVRPRQRRQRTPPRDRLHQRRAVLLHNGGNWRTAGVLLGCWLCVRRWLRKRRRGSRGSPLSTRLAGHGGD